MSLLAIGLGLTGFKMKQAYDDQQYLTEVQQLANTLQTAQDLMLILDAEVDVVFFEDPKDRRIGYKLISESGRIPKEWLALIGKDTLLNKVRYLSIDGVTPSTSPTLKLHFYSRGLAMSQATVVVSKGDRADPKDSNQILMHGYPHFIKSEPYKTENRGDSPLSRLLMMGSQLYPNEVWKDLNKNEKNNKDKAA